MSDKTTTDSEEEIPAIDKTKTSKPSMLVPILVVLILIIGAVFVGLSMTKESENFAKDVKTKQYQAVFLTNGQVYFGKIDEQKKDTLKLKNIYYLQVQKDVQPAENADAQASDQNLSLAKLGKELHGPEDVMYISTDQILFWENLKNDSQVVKSIKEQK